MTGGGTGFAWFFPSAKSTKKACALKRFPLRLNLLGLAW
jgi:hypothetical protein